MTIITMAFRRGVLLTVMLCRQWSHGSEDEMQTHLLLTNMYMPKKPDAANPAIASLFPGADQWRGVADPGRFVTRQ